MDEDLTIVIDEDLGAQLLVLALALALLAKGFSSPASIKKQFTPRSFKLSEVASQLAASRKNFLSEVQTLLRVGAPSYIKRTLFSIGKRVK